MLQLNIIKLGGSLITDKSVPRALRPEAIRQIAGEIGQLYKQNPEMGWIIGNGAGSFGHYTVQKVRYKQRPADKNAIDSVRQSVRELNAHVVKALKDVGLPAVSLPPSTFIRQAKNKIVCDVGAVIELLENREIPIVYGDVIDDEIQGSRIISTEETFDTLARPLLTEGFSVDALVFATSVDGVLGKNGSNIPVLRASDPIHSMANAAYDVTGGMVQKVDWGFKALDYSQKVFIINGAKKNSLASALSGKTTGTELVK